jgi:hypothetical protein
VLAQQKEIKMCVVSLLNALERSSAFFSTPFNSLSRQLSRTLELSNSLSSLFLLCVSVSPSHNLRPLVYHLGKSFEFCALQLSPVLQALSGGWSETGEQQVGERE